MSLKVEIIPVTAFQQNCSLVWCDSTKEVALIDPGGNTELLLERIEAHGVQLKQILLTHAHIDHAGAAAGIFAHHIALSCLVLPFFVTVVALNLDSTLV